jgi:hypothetical protein
MKEKAVRLKRQSIHRNELVSVSTREAVTEAVHYLLQTRVAIGTLHHNERPMGLQGFHRTFDYLSLISFRVDFQGRDAIRRNREAAGCEQVVQSLYARPKLA